MTVTSFNSKSGRPVTQRTQMNKITNTTGCDVM